MNKSFIEKLGERWKVMPLSQKVALIVVTVILTIVCVLGLMDIFGPSRVQSSIAPMSSNTSQASTHHQFENNIGEKSLFSRKSSLEQQQIHEQQVEAKQALEKGKSYLGTTFGELKHEDKVKKNTSKVKKQKPKKTGYYAANLNKKNNQSKALVIPDPQVRERLQNYQSNASGHIEQNIKLAINKITNRKLTGIYTVTESVIATKSNKVDSQESQQLINKYKTSDLSSKDLNISASHTRSPSVLPGSTYFGVMDSKVNSDNPGPVIANIVSGKLRGAKLLGAFQRQNDKVAIKFNQMVFEKQSYSIDAVAVNSNTYATALADSVDHHYLERYGLFFVGSFLGGISNAILNEGQTTTTSTSSQTIKQQLNTRDQIMVGLGNTGNQLAPQLEKNFNIPPTVTVNRGSGVGILFLKAVTLTKTRYEYQTPQWEKALSN